jgi:putative flippase GtrA
MEQVTVRVTQPSGEGAAPEQPVPDGASKAAGGTAASDGPLLRLVKDRRVAFLIVGVTNTIVGFGWFALFEVAVGQWLGTYGYMVTLLLAHIASVLCAFVLYRKFVFRVTGHVWIDLLRFESVYLVSLGINAALLPLLVEFAHLTPIVAQALIVFVTTLVSYFGHSRFSFRRLRGVE